MRPDNLSQEFDGLNARIEFAFTHKEEVTEHFFIRGRSISGHPRPAFTPKFEEFFCPSLAGPGTKVPVIHRRRGYVEFGVANWGETPDDEGVPRYYRDAQHRSLGYPALIAASSIFIPVVNDGVSWDTVRISPISGSVLFIGCVFIPDQFGRAQSVIPLIRKAGLSMAEHSDWEFLRLPILPQPHDENFRFINGADKGWLQMAPLPAVEVERFNAMGEAWLAQSGGDRRFQSRPPAC